MRRLPRKARIYYWLTLLISVLTLSWAILSDNPAFTNSPIGLVCLLFLALIAGSRKVQIIRGTNVEDNDSMSLGFVIFFATLLLYGPRGGLLVAMLSCISSCYYPKRQPFYQLFFNLALTILEAWYAGLMFFTTNLHSLKITPYNSIPASVLATLVYFSINTVGVAAIIGLCSDQNPLKLWKDKFLWTIPSYLAGAAVSTMAVLLFHGQFAVHLLLGAPIAYLTYQSYAIYIARTEEKQQYIEKLQVNQEHLSDLYLATVKSMALAIGAKDQYTHQHILRVQHYALTIAAEMHLTESELEAVETGALLHDIGKLGVPEHILLKPDPLTDEEYAKIKKHPEIGAAILDPVNFPSPVVSAVKHHHERWDRSGYPDGLVGEEIPLTARILAVADVYDALTTPRPYRDAWTRDAALDFIRNQSGIYFDPVIIKHFLQVIDSINCQEGLPGYLDASQEVKIKATGSPAMAPPNDAKVTTKADQAAQDIQRASTEVWTLYQVAESISNCFGLEDTVNILADKLQVIFPGTTCLLLLLDKNSDMLQVRTARGINEGYFENGCVSNNGSRSTLVVQSRQTYLGDYDADDLKLAVPPDQGWTPLQSALIVPIIYQGEVLGTINLYHPDTDFFTPYYRELLETITERAARALYNGYLFDRTHSHAITDPLTGLYNVQYVAQYVEQWCAQRNQQRDAEMCVCSQTDSPGEEGSSVPAADTALILDQKADNLALLCLDLDNFKPVNDNYGHQKGDQVLRELSTLFRSMVRDKDIVARYGGDEFLIVIQAASPAEANALSLRLQEAVEQYNPGLMHPGLGALRLGVSIGYACYSIDGNDYPSLLAIADNRMYSNKTERKLRLLAQNLPSGSLSSDLARQTLLLPESESAANLAACRSAVMVVQSLLTRETTTTQSEEQR